MLPGAGLKIKREEKEITEEQLHDSTTAGWAVNGHRKRVREMAKRLAAGAGFGRSAQANSGDATHGETAMQMAGMSRQIEPSRETPPPTMKTPRYDGKANWEAFHAQFELLAQAGRWSTAEKALQLAMSLTGDALTSLLLLSPNDRSDYNALVGALKRRFGLCSAASLLRSELCSRQRRSEEPLRDLANDIEGLVHRTYSHMPPAIQGELARDYFLQALQPADLRVQTLLAHPKSLQEALELATEREMLCCGTKEAVCENTSKVRAAVGAELREAEPAWVEKLTQLVHATTLREEQSPRRRPRVCWGCGQPGHLVRQCPHISKNQGNGMGNV